MQSEKRIIRPSRTAHDWHLHECFGCGRHNPHGLKADFPFDEEHGEVRFVYHPQQHQLGPPEHVHGGVLAALMDEAQGVLCFHVGHLILTDRLNMKYHKATPIDQPIQIRCWMTSVRRRRLYTRGTIHNLEGELLVSSRAVWYLLPERLIRRLYSEKFTADYEYIRQVIELNRRRAKEIRKRLRQSR